jgi:U3 small nucleolar RNA-associated protein 14
LQKVENYEYEMPSDFEDEEIDEDLAFTAEDKVKYGSWFDEEPGDEQRDEDLHSLDSEEGEGLDASGEDEVRMQVYVSCQQPSGAAAAAAAMGVMLPGSTLS